MIDNLPGHLFVMSDKDKKIVEDFAVKIVPTVKKIYEERDNQKYDVNPERLKEQQIGAKFAELAVYRYVSSLGLTCSSPDFTIYERKKKNWSPDLKLEGDIPIHVKSQETWMAEKRGVSWLVEKFDKELYINNTGYVALCLLNLKEGRVKILGVPKASFLKESGILFGIPKVDKLRATKSAIYYDSLKIYEKDIWSLKNA